MNINKLMHGNEWMSNKSVDLMNYETNERVNEWINEWTIVWMGKLMNKSMN